MDCADECAILRREVGPVVGGEDKLSFDILNARMTVNGATAAPDAVIKAVARTGMRAEVWLADEHEGPGVPGVPGIKDARGRRRRTLLTVASGVFGADHR
jgi:Cd2+/Zn2+-exporting ATPase